MLIAAIPGFGLLAVWWMLDHGLPGFAWGGVLQGYLFVSCLAASILQIGKIIGRFADIPNATLAFAGFDVLALDLVRGGRDNGLAGWGTTVWALGFGAWIIGFVGTAFGAPIVQHRRREADAAIAHMRQAEQKSAEGEGW